MIKYRIVFILNLLVLLIASCTTKPVQLSESKIQFTYSRLKLLDLDEATELITDRLDAYKETNNKNKLIEALTLSLSRPTEDNTTGRLLSSVKKVADLSDDAQLWNSILESTLNRSVESLIDKKSAAVDQVTHLILLQNWLSEIRPELKRTENDTQFERNLVKKIDEANIEVSKEADQESSLNMMSRLRSPSQIAQDILGELKTKNN